MSDAAPVSQADQLMLAAIADLAVEGDVLFHHLRTLVARIEEHRELPALILYMRSEQAMIVDRLRDIAVEMAGFRDKAPSLRTELGCLASLYLAACKKAEDQ